MVNNVPFEGSKRGVNHWITSGLVNLMYFIELEITKHYKITKTFQKKINFILKKF